MFTQLVVPLDGSHFAARAIPPAVAISLRTRCALRLVGIARDDTDVSWMRTHLEHTARRASVIPPPEIDVVVHPDPTRLLLDVAADPRNLLCFASHDRMRIASEVMHAIGSAIIATARHPFVVVGENGETTGGGREVVAAVDGVNNPQPIIATAIAWTQRLAAPLRIVTVCEPGRGGPRQHGHRARRYWPTDGIDHYLEALGRDAERGGAPSVTTASIADPVSAAHGLAGHLEHRPGRLVIVGGAHPDHVSIGGGTVHDLLGSIAQPMVVVNRARTVTVPHTRIKTITTEPERNLSWHFQTS